MKIVFIMGSFNAQRCMKRIDEFVEQGYEVEAFAFDRGKEAKKLPKSVTIQKIGNIDPTAGYKSRLGILYKGIKSVIEHFEGQNVIFYVFGLANASFVKHLTDKPYIYEESDLVHTYLRPKILVRAMEWLDKRVIAKSIMTVFTSEGFVRYHYGKAQPENTWVISNRLPADVSQLEAKSKKTSDKENLSIGFVGFLRFKSIYTFADIIGRRFPNIQFHFFGTASNEKDGAMFEALHKYENIHFHGAFRHPVDLPEIYAQIDIVLSTYDVEHDNVRYAEPNKIYEAIYFRTPIIVSTGTFLAEKVQQMGIGYDIDPLNEKEVCDFLSEITHESIMEKTTTIESIPCQEALNINTNFFNKLNSIITNKL